MVMILVGTCGYSYKDWVDSVYSDVRHALSTYIKIFKAVEIDSTFYSIPSKQIVGSWINRFPRGFHITMKIPKSVTHEKRLGRDSLDDLKIFLQAVAPLIGGGLLRVLLVQLPPSLKLDLDKLENFIAAAKSLEGRIKWAVEFRHVSWMNDRTFKLLEKYGASFVVVDEPGLPFIARKTSDISYVRFHGRGREIWYDYLYSTRELGERVPQLLELGREGDLYIMFNNHPNGQAVLNALQMSQLLGLEISPSGLSLMRRLQRRLASK